MTHRDISHSALPWMQCLARHSIQPAHHCITLNTRYLQQAVKAGSLIAHFASGQKTSRHSHSSRCTRCYSCSPTATTALLQASCGGGSNMCRGVLAYIAFCNQV